MLLKAIEYKLLEDESYVLEELNIEKVKTDLKLSNDNYESVSVSLFNGKPRIVIVGKNKWSGITAYGSLTSLNVISSEEYASLVPIITIIGDNSVSIGLGETYVDAGATAVEKAGDAGDITGAINTIENVDTNVIGEYSVVYSVVNSLGNESTVVRIVNVVWVCGSNYIDNRDDKTYATVQIGTQCWFKEDLAYDCSLAGYNNIGSGTSWSGTNNCGNQGAGNNGLFYQWPVAMNGSDGLSGDPVQGLCPEGWYIPNHDDFTDLERHVCVSAGNSDCVTKFPKDLTTEVWRGTNEGEGLKSETWNGNNASGFTALPAGRRNSIGSLTLVGTHGEWWSSTPSVGSEAWRRYLRTANSDVLRFDYSQANGFSVRCLMGQ